MSLASDKKLAESLLGTSIDMLEARNREIFSLRARRDELLEALQRLADAMAILAARGIAPAIDQPELVHGVEIIAKVTAAATSGAER